MRRLLAASVGLAFVVGLAHGFDPSFATGDAKLDSTLEQLDIAARADPDDFVRRLSSMHHVPEQELRQARDTFGLGGADLFMATGLARETHRPVHSVAEEFQRSQGKGWGVIAKNLGIKPGSSEFHRLKRDAKGSLNYMNSSAKSTQKQEQKMTKASQGQGHGKS
jgi:hypothetical protein